MIEKNRYKAADFISKVSLLDMKVDNEITISEKHDIVIYLEPIQRVKFNELIKWFETICMAVPDLDNQVQEYFENKDSIDGFPFDLAVIYFEGNTITMDYWGRNCNTQFDMKFSFDGKNWQRIEGNAVH
ncbi:hypothetical protein ACYSNR_07150 [Enterococcus sp. LJL128]